MVRCVVNLILDVGRNIKWIMTLNLCIMTLKKILKINYIYGSLKKPMAKKIWWEGNNIVYLSDNG